MNIASLPFIVDRLEILKSSLNDNARYDFYIKGFDKPLYLTSTELLSLSKFRGKFMEHTGWVLSGPREIWLQITRDLICKGIILKSDKEILLTIIYNIINTDILNGEIDNPETRLKNNCVIYNNHVHLNIDAILQRLKPRDKVLLSNKQIARKFIGDVLRTIGFKNNPIKINKTTKRTWNIDIKDFRKFRSDTQLEIYQQPYAMS